MSTKIRIEVEPAAARDEIVGGDPLTVRVEAPAARGAANRAAVRVLTAYFGKRVRIISGGRRRKKIIEVG